MSIRYIIHTFRFFFIFCVLLSSSLLALNAQTVIEMKDSVILNPGCRPNSIRDNAKHYWVGTDCGLTSIHKQDSSIAHFYPGGIEGTGVYVIQLFEDGYMLVFQGENFLLLDDKQVVVETYSLFNNMYDRIIYINSIETDNGSVLIHATDHWPINLVLGYKRESGFRHLMDIETNNFFIFQGLRDMSSLPEENLLSGYWVGIDRDKVAIITEDFQFRVVTLSDPTPFLREPFVVDTSVFVTGRSGTFKILEDGNLTEINALYPAGFRYDNFYEFKALRLDNGTNLLLTPFHDYKASFINDTLIIEYFFQNQDFEFYRNWLSVVHKNQQNLIVRIASKEVNKLIVQVLNAGTSKHFLTSNFLPDMSGGNFRDGKVLEDGRLILNYYGGDLFATITDLEQQSNIRVRQDLEMSAHLNLNSSIHLWVDNNKMLYEMNDDSLQISDFQLPVVLDSFPGFKLTQSLKIAGYKSTSGEVIHFDLFDQSKEIWQVPASFNGGRYLTNSCLFQIQFYNEPQNAVKVNCMDGFQSEFFLPMGIGLFDIAKIAEQPDQIMLKSKDYLMILSKDSIVRTIPNLANSIDNIIAGYNHPFFIVRNFNSTTKINAEEQIELNIQGKYIGEDQLGNIFSIVGGKLVVYHPDTVKLPPTVPRPIPNQLFLKVVEDTNGNGLFDEEDVAIDWARVTIEDDNSTYFRSLNTFQKSIYDTFSDSVKYSIDLGAYEIISGEQVGVASFMNASECIDSVLVRSIENDSIGLEFESYGTDTLNSGLRSLMSFTCINLSKRSYIVDVQLDVSQSNSYLCLKNSKFKPEGQNYNWSSIVLPRESSKHYINFFDGLDCVPDLENRYFKFNVKASRLNGQEYLNLEKQMAFRPHRPLYLHTRIESDSINWNQTPLKYFALPDHEIRIHNSIDYIPLNSDNESWKIVNTFSGYFFDTSSINIIDKDRDFIHTWINDTTLISELIWKQEFDCDNRNNCLDNIYNYFRGFIIAIKPNPNLPHLTLIENRPVIWAGDRLFTDTLKSDILFLNTTISTSEASVKSIFKIFPNPAHQTLTIDHLMPDQHVKVDACKIFNTLGQLVHFEKIELPAQVNVSSWPPGLYSMILFNNGEWISSQKFVVSD